MDKDDLLKEMLLSKEQGKWTEKGVEYIFEIVDDLEERYLSKWKLSKEDHKDLKAFAIMQCYERGLNFKPEKLTDGYAYLSVIARCSFAGMFKKLKC